ncbi:hypothetical protein [Ramlibacter albus]|uniref:Uncharacterized protein n=1 Tax=Ramlibacter albus TaxID=2079448 RepID=A0A923S608_9BURK|nr:hypothetical protein [Ramlibacter albus]MBC5768563.1 hypothetical protein [Ramlibacter albus]
MPTHRRRTAALAKKSSELALAAPAVVTLRLLRMAEHGNQPDARDRAEMMRMGSEKVAAFSQAWMAMWMQWWLAPLQFLQGNWVQAGSRAMTALLSAGIAPVHRTAVANARRLGRRRR